MKNRANPKLLQNMNSIMNLFNRSLNTILKTYPVPLSMASYTMLWTVYDNPGLTQYQLSKISGYTNQRCQQIISALLDSELIIRDKNDFGNKYNIYISPRGNEVLNELYDIFHSKLYEKLDPEAMELAERISIDVNRLTELI